jgi:pheromone a factor receptor
MQNSQFIIIEDYGCDISAPATWVLLIIIVILPLILELISGVYGCLSIHAFYNRSKLNETHNILNPDRYIRLMCFSAVDLLTGIPISLYYLYVDVLELVPFPAITQDQFSLIFHLPAVAWRATPLSELSYELNRWIIVWSAFIFFAIFGFTEESRNNYRAVLQSVVQVFVKIGIKSRPRNKAEGYVISFFFSFFV